MSKFQYNELPLEEVVREANRRNILNVASECGPDVKDLVVRIYDPEPDGNYGVRISMAAIPNEYARLMRRINDLENEVRFSRGTNDLYAPVYDLLARANAKVDKEKDS
jgi:hypothetical protein